ncbi:MAG: lysophospholipid acyltransferase family protein [Planctomycetota bacterium]|nr:lysophospholipid acyltransferase family protein [Planctomycetota bacterium]
MTETEHGMTGKPAKSSTERQTVPGEVRPRKKADARSWSDRLLYCGLNNFFRLIWMVYFGLRVFQARRYPQDGAVLICSNHQSHLDPILVGNSSPRYVSFVARESLFKLKWFGWIIAALGAFPINRESGLSGVKKTLKRLKNGEMVLIFPEGTRTPDGEIKEFKPGFCAIARRAKVPIVPVAIEGAYDAWPKSSWFPTPCPIHLKVGEPIGVERVAQLSDQDLTQLVQEAVLNLQMEIRRQDYSGRSLPDSKNEH